MALVNQKKHEAADRKRIDHEKANEKLKEHTSNHINNIVEVKFQKSETQIFVSNLICFFPIHIFCFQSNFMFPNDINECLQITYHR